MIKTTIIISAALFGTVAAGTKAAHKTPSPSTAEQTLLPIPSADNVIAQFSYLEISHDFDGFSVSVTEKSAVFIDVEFPGDLHIRIGF